MRLCQRAARPAPSPSADESCTSMKSIDKLPENSCASGWRDKTPWDIGASDLNGDKLHEECGIFGVIGARDAAAVTALGLHALQHRGQEAVGITSFDGHE